MWTIVINLFSALAKVLPAILAWFAAKKSAKAEALEENAKIIEKQRDVKPVRSYDDVRARVRKHRK